MNGLIEPPESIRRGGSLNVQEMGLAGLQSFRCIMKSYCYIIKLIRCNQLFVLNNSSERA